MDDSTSLPPEPPAPGPAQPAPKSQKPGFLSALARDIFGTIVPAIVIALLIHAFLAQATRVYGQSMEPNFHTNERLVVEKLSYHFHGPQRGDVVVLRDPNSGPDPLIKRVIGLPGERVTISNGRVYVDGVALDEPYLHQATLQGNGRSWLVPPLEVFVMGDNRSASRDSRAFGTISRDLIIGRAIFRYWPLEQIGVVR
jgi:signal peptidase I